MKIAKYGCILVHISGDFQGKKKDIDHYLFLNKTEITGASP
jgi:hypothetical protein